MKFLAVDTSSERLIVAAYREGETFLRVQKCAMRHSVLLMDEIDAALQEANLTLQELDFVACVVGPGSFTGIRIGISAVKGMCFAASLPALAVTSFDCLAYTERGGKRLALVDAGHGMFYGCPYEDDTSGTPAYISGEGAEALLKEGYRPVTDQTHDRAEGLAGAVLSLQGNAAPAEKLAAMYLRKSAAEEGR